MSQWRKQVVKSFRLLLIRKSFTILRSGEALISFNKNDLVNFSVEKMFNEAFRNDYFLRIREKR